MVSWAGNAHDCVIYKERIDKKFLSCSEYYDRVKLRTAAYKTIPGKPTT